MSVPISRLTAGRLPRPERSPRGQARWRRLVATLTASRGCAYTAPLMPKAYPPCPHCGSTAGPDHPCPAPMLGKVLDNRYQIESVLGHGGMGMVFLATQTAEAPGGAEDAAPVAGVGA